METARRGVELVAYTDAFERLHLRKIAKRHGADAVHEIKVEAWLALCTPLSPLLGVWFSPRFANSEDAYDLTKRALNLARKNWTNREKARKTRLESLCGAFVRDGTLTEPQDDDYSGEGGDGVDVGGEAPDTDGVPVDEAVDLLNLTTGLIESFRPEEQPIAALLMSEYSIPDITALTGESKVDVQNVRKALEEKAAPYRPEPSKPRKPYARKKYRKPKRKSTELDEASASFKAASRKYRFVGGNRAPAKAALKSGKPAPAAAAEMAAMIAAIDGRKAAIRKSNS